MGSLLGHGLMQVSGGIKKDGVEKGKTKTLGYLHVLGHLHLSGPLHF